MLRTPRGLFLGDQRDRKTSSTGSEMIAKNDSYRRKEISNWLKSKLSHSKPTAAELFYAAMIFHHGLSKEDASRAKRLALQSFEAGYKKAGWLYAAATDRLLVRENKPQKFGTQYFRRSAGAKWRLYKVDRKVSDTVRKQYGVLPLKKQMERIRKLNVKV